MEDIANGPKIDVDLKVDDIKTLNKLFFEFPLTKADAFELDRYVKEMMLTSISSVFVGGLGAYSFYKITEKVWNLKSSRYHKAYRFAGITAGILAVDTLISYGTKRIDFEHGYRSLYLRTPIGKEFRDYLKIDPDIVYNDFPNDLPIVQDLRKKGKNLPGEKEEILYRKKPDLREGPPSITSKSQYEDKGGAADDNSYQKRRDPAPDEYYTSNTRRPMEPSEQIEDIGYTKEDPRDASTQRSSESLYNDNLSPAKSPGGYSAKKDYSDDNRSTNLYSNDEKTREVTEAASQRLAKIRLQRQEEALKKKLDLVEARKRRLEKENEDSVDTSNNRSGYGSNDSSGYGGNDNKLIRNDNKPSRRRNKYGDDMEVVRE